ncbi:MAG: MFS transporter [Thermodesulfobacteriota bacterium]
MVPREEGGLRSWTPRLKAVIVLCFLANLLCLLVRINVSIAAPLISTEFGWDEARMGLVFSSFFAGYVLFMIPGGVLADRYGSRRVLAWGVGLWSVFSLATARSQSLAGLILFRFLTGAAQGVNFPCITNLIARRVPLVDRAKTQGFVLSGMVVGSVVGLPAGGWIVEAWGWPAVFWAFGGVGFLWVALWLRWTPQEPAARVGHPRETGPPWRTFLTHPAPVGLTLSYFCHNYGSYFLLTWLPTYLVHVHGLSVTATGAASALPALASVVAMNASGWVGDSLVRRGRSTDFARKVMLCGGMAGSGVFLFALLGSPSPFAAVAWLTVSSAARSLATPTYWTLAMDMAPRHAGILSSIMNTSGNVAGVAAPMLTGLLVAQSGTWGPSIALAAAVSLAGAAIAAPTVRASEIA